MLHIELRKWADILVIAPLSANTLAKVSNGLSDNLLSCVVRAWDFKHRPMLLVPAMNTLMYEHPLTERQLRTFIETHMIVEGRCSNKDKKLIEGSYSSIRVLNPASKLLACGDEGRGALPPVSSIVKHVEDMLFEDRRKEEDRKEEDRKEGGEDITHRFLPVEKTISSFSWFKPVLYSSFISSSLTCFLVFLLSSSRLFHFCKK